jgi:hypothetical protein
MTFVFSTLELANDVTNNNFIDAFWIGAEACTLVDSKGNV